MLTNGKQPALSRATSVDADRRLQTPTEGVAGDSENFDALWRGRAHLAHNLSDGQFEAIRRFALQNAGISIADHKKTMVARRILRRVKALSLETFEAYFDFLQGPAGRSEIQPLINVLTTNKTSFFRESHHFEHLTDVAIPHLLAAKSRSGERSLRLWSAGCSTGEEAWSIAIAVAHAMWRRRDWDIRIFATDIDTDVLSIAKRGVYGADELVQVPADVKRRFFEKSSSESGGYRVAETLRTMVSFKQLNLHNAWPLNGPIDVIFCRNVVIYFDKPSQRALYNRFANILSSDGYLYCGHSETLHGASTRFESIGHSINKRVL